MDDRSGTKDDWAYEILARSLRTNAYFMFGVFRDMKQDSAYVWLERNTFEDIGTIRGTYDSVQESLLDRYGIEQLIHRVVRPRVTGERGLISEAARDYLKDRWDRGEDVSAKECEALNPRNPKCEPFLRISTVGDVKYVEWSIFAFIWFELIEPLGDVRVRGNADLRQDPLVDGGGLKCTREDDPFPPFSQDEPEEYTTEMRVSAAVRGMGQKRFRIWERRERLQEGRQFVMQGEQKVTEEGIPTRDFMVDEQGIYLPAYWIGRHGLQPIPEVVLRRRIRRAEPILPGCESPLQEETRRDGHHIVRIMSEDRSLLKDGEPNKALIAKMIAAWIVCRDREEP